MFANNPFSKNLRGYSRKKEGKFILDKNCIYSDDTKNIFFNKINLDKRMDDYEYEKKYIKFVKEMKLKIGNFVDFESELRKKKRVIKESNLFNKIGLNNPPAQKIDKNNFPSTSYFSTEIQNNNINLNFNTNLMNETNHINLLIKDDTTKIIKCCQNKDDPSVIRMQHQKENPLKNDRNQQKFTNTLLNSKVNLNNQNLISDGNNNYINKNNFFPNGISARKFLSNKFSNKLKNGSSTSLIKKNISEIFITKNTIKTNEFSELKNKIVNFKEDLNINLNQTNKNFCLSQNKFYINRNFRDQINIDINNTNYNQRPESRNNHYESRKEFNNIQDNFTPINKKNKLRKSFFSKKEDIKILFDKEIYSNQLYRKETNSVSKQNRFKKYLNINENKFLKLNNEITNLKASGSFKISTNKINNKLRIKTNILENKSYKNLTDTSDESINKINNIDIYSINISPIKKSSQSIKIRDNNLFNESGNKINNKTNFNKFKELKNLQVNRKLNFFDKKKRDLDESDFYNQSKSDNSSIFVTPRRYFSAKDAYHRLNDRNGQFKKEIMAISFHNVNTKRDAKSKWYNPSQKIKRKNLMKNVNDDKKEDREGVELPKADKRDKDFIKTPDDNHTCKKIYFIERNKANMINHINTISRMKDENYIKYGDFLERKYDFYANQVDIPEYIFESARYRPKTNTRNIDIRTQKIKIVFGSILKTKNRIFGSKKN